MSLAYLFIRDDDVCTMSGAFTFFLRTALEAGVPVVYAVIPQRMDRPLIRSLKALKKSAPATLDIVQHGWTHEDHALKGETKYEFGPSRRPGQQRVDICTGYAAMRRSFGPAFTPAFVPPYHGFDAVTLQEVRRAGLRAFSAGRAPANVPEGCLNLPARVSLNAYAADGTAKTFTAAAMLARVRRALRPGALTGAVIHHEVLATARDRQALKTFFQGISRWQEQGEMKVVLFSDILRAHERSEENLKK